MNLGPGMDLPPCLTYAAFTDGTSNTAAVSEFRLGPFAEVNDVKRTLFGTAVSMPDPSQFDVFLKQCESIDFNNPGVTDVSRGVRALDFRANTTLYNHALVPNGVSCLNGTNGFTGAVRAGSLHSGLVNSVFADGHVSSIKDGVSLPVWRALGTRNGGELAPSF